MARSQNGWVANDRSLVSSRLIPGSSVRVTVRDGAAGDVLLYVASQVDQRVEDIDNARGALDDWGYAERPIRGGRALSNHASGTAIDLNATKHPLARRGTFTREQVGEIHRILDEVGHVVRWGGDYRGRADEMHFEINDTPERVAAVAARLTTRETDMLRRGDQGPDVEWLQDRLNVVLDGKKDGRLRRDGDYGGNTADAVAAAKKTLGWADDDGDVASAWFGNRLEARISWSDIDRKLAEHRGEGH